MKKQMKPSSLSFLLLLVVWAVLLPTQPRLQAEETEEKSLSLEEKQEMVQKLFASVPLLPQNMRPFETLSFRYIEEKSTDNGVSWTVMKKGRVVFDVKKGHLKWFLLTHKSKENRISFEGILRHKDKLYMSNDSIEYNPAYMGRNFDIEEDWSCHLLQISRCDHIRDISAFIMKIGWWEFWEVDNETNYLINDLLSNKMLFDNIEEVIYREGSDEVAIQASF